MAAADFAVTKLDGSAWLFEPKSLGDNGSSIIFHVPYPSNKIPFHKLRRHGRRLTRTYGWNAHTFGLAEKNKENEEDGGETGNGS